MSLRFLTVIVVLLSSWAFAYPTPARAQFFDPSQFLERADTNKNGSIDPDELEDRSAYFIRRMLERNDRFDTSRPIPIRDIQDEFDRMRRERERDGGSRFGGGFRRDDDNRDRGGDRDRGGFGRGGFGRGGFSRGGFGRSGFDRSDGRDSRSSNASKEDEDPRDQRKSYRFLPASERLPEGLPDWFYDQDSDGDGQVMMAEFASTWNAKQVEEFLRFDLNHDGLITPDECLDAGDEGVKRDETLLAAAFDDSANSLGDSSETSQSSTYQASTSSTNSSPANALPTASGDLAEEVNKINKNYLNYYQKLFAKYDVNNDGQLTAEEGKEMANDPKDADRDGDGLVSFGEYALWSYAKHSN